LVDHLFEFPVCLLEFSHFVCDQVMDGEEFLLFIMRKINWEDNFEVVDGDRFII